MSLHTLTHKFALHLKNSLKHEHTHTHALIWYTFHHQTQAINFYELSDLPEIKMYERCVEEYRVCDVRIY